jgi:hypothetical protein
MFSVFIFKILTPIIESARTPARITPYPTGRLFRVALTQALRARLPSACPSGTKAIHPSKTRIKLAFMPLRSGACSVAVAPRREEQNTGETPTTIASASCLSKVVASRGCLTFSKSPNSRPSTSRAWLRSGCPSGTKYILTVEALIKLALMGFTPVG